MHLRYWQVSDALTCSRFTSRLKTWDGSYRFCCPLKMLAGISNVRYYLQMDDVFLRSRVKGSLQGW